MKIEEFSFKLKAESINMDYQYITGLQELLLLFILIVLACWCVQNNFVKTSLQLSEKAVQE